MIAFLTTALPAILGALAGMVPAIIGYFDKKEDNAQAVRMEQLRQQGAREQAAAQVDIANTQADVRQADHIYGFANQSTGYRVVDAVVILVRPYITMVIFHLWAALEVMLFIYAVNKGYDAGQIYKLLWDEPTQAIFAAIIGFWFGNRMMTRRQQMVATMAVTKK